ncbi:Sodium/solute symporter [Trinorchestia longiramus]|nr:Sodium/solute symporter [Trinorchestia longiramus]
MEDIVTTPTFSPMDYFVFSVMIVASLGIGVYHCMRGNRTTDDFLLAGRSMTPVPIALSLTATFISSISILGNVGEVYGHGIQFMWGIIGSIFGVVLAAQVFAPIIYNMKLASINEYLERRFRSQLLKKTVMVTSAATNLLYLGLCLYAPTLALESVTPIKSSTYIVMLGMVVTIYSSFGGMKAVVWTDAFQTFVIILGVIIATTAAIILGGGLGEVWTVASKYGRTQALDFRVGLHVRHTVINTVLMNFLNYTSHYSFAQSTVQRLGAMSSLRKAKLVLYLNITGIAALLSLLNVCGLAIFTVYAGCDPITLGLVSKKDQMLPYFVIGYLGFLKGVPGLFVACLISGTMSSISSVLNSIPTMLWNDFMSELPYFQRASEHVKTIATKLLTFSMGVMMIGLAFMVSRMEGLIQATATLLSVLHGPTIGVFLLGFCVPFCNSKGVMAGLLSSVVFMTWLGVGMQLHGAKPELLPLHISHCSPDSSGFNASTSAMSSLSFLPTEAAPGVLDDPTTEHPLFGFYGISYTYLSTVGASVCIIVASIVSLATGQENYAELDEECLLPFLRKYCSPKPPPQSAEQTAFLESSTAITVEKPPAHVHHK